MTSLTRRLTQDEAALIAAVVRLGYATKQHATRVVTRRETAVMQQWRVKAEADGVPVTPDGSIVVYRPLGVAFRVKTTKEAGDA